MTFPYWHDPEWGTPDQSIWDVLYLGSEVWPGAWRVDAVKEREIDKAKAAGVNGYTLTNKGFKGAPIKATGVLWLPEHLEAFSQIFPRYDPEYLGVSSPLDIYHPQTELLRVYTVFLHKISVSGPDRKRLTVVLEMDQWFPETRPAKTTTKPKGFDGAAGANAPLNPEDFRVGPPEI
jgi:hypothetical protein